MFLRSSSARYSRFRFWPFHQPVDPAELGVPHYHEIIPPADCRDLETICKHLDAHDYLSVDEWAADIALMTANAIKFNGEASYVGDFARKVLQKWNTAIAKKKREDAANALPKRALGGGNESTPNKKAKLGP